MRKGNLPSSLYPDVYGSDMVLYGSKSLVPSLEINMSSTHLGTRLLEYGVYLDKSSRSVSFAGDINGDSIGDMIVGDPLNSVCYVFYGESGSAVKGYSRGYFIYGESKNNLFGWGVSTAGDFNGDGYDDLIVSALLGGKVYLMWGGVPTKPSSLYRKNVYVSSMSSRDGLKLTSSSSLISSLGVAVSNVGDVNDDGMADIAVTGMGRSGDNVIYVLFGSSSAYLGKTTVDVSLLGAAECLTLTSTTFSFAGLSLSALWDVNGDGIDDFIMGSLPYSSGYSTQRSYVVFGSSELSSMGTVHVVNITKTNGFTIIGGGIVVGGPGDVNEDGVSDILVANYANWQGKSNSLILPYPSKQTSFPTSYPSSSPTSIRFPTDQPSSFPSSIPSSSPTRKVIHPTRAPTLPPQGPTLSPTADPTSPTSYPSSRPSVITNIPTFRPSRVPTRSPTRRPTFAPSTRLPSPSPSCFPSTELPTLTPPTVKPSRAPSFRPSFHPTTDPTISPTFAPNTGWTTIVITSPGSYEGQDTNEIYEIKAENETIIQGNKGMKKYMIYPIANSTIIITDFSNEKDVLDFSNFDGAQFHYDYSTNPLVFRLPENERVILSSHESLDLSNTNVVYPANADNPVTTSDSSARSSLSSEVIYSVSLLGGLLLISFLFSNRHRLFDRFLPAWMHKVPAGKKVANVKPVALPAKNILLSPPPKSAILSPSIIMEIESKLDEAENENESNSGRSSPSRPAPSVSSDNDDEKEEGKYDRSGASRNTQSSVRSESAAVDSNYRSDDSSVELTSSGSSNHSEAGYHHLIHQRRREVEEQQNDPLSSPRPWRLRRKDDDSSDSDSETRHHVPADWKDRLEQSQNAFLLQSRHPNHPIPASESKKSEEILSPSQMLRNSQIDISWKTPTGHQSIRQPTASNHEKDHYPPRNEEEAEDNDHDDDEYSFFSVDESEVEQYFPRKPKEDWKNRLQRAQNNHLVQFRPPKNH